MDSRTATIIHAPRDCESALTSNILKSQGKYAPQKNTLGRDSLSPEKYNNIQKDAGQRCIHKKYVHERHSLSLSLHSGVYTLFSFPGLTDFLIASPCTRSLDSPLLLGHAKDLVYSFHRRDAKPEFSISGPEIITRGRGVRASMRALIKNSAQNNTICKSHLFSRGRVASTSASSLRGAFGYGRINRRIPRSASGNYLCCCAGSAPLWAVDGARNRSAPLLRRRCRQTRHALSHSADGFGSIGRHVTRAKTSPLEQRRPD